MAEYYLISQLPSLDGLGDNMPLPITEERFLELCERFLGKKARLDLEKLTLEPSYNPEKINSVLLEKWSKGERNLRVSLAKSRADKMKKPFDLADKTIDNELLKVANTAVEFESPLEAEVFLNNYRLEFLETLRPTDNFSEDFVFYYGIKLKLISRIRQFDKTVGENQYENIYNSIINGDRLEDIQ